MAFSRFLQALSPAQRGQSCLPCLPMKTVPHSLCHQRDCCAAVHRQTSRHLDGALQLFVDGDYIVYSYTYRRALCFGVWCRLCQRVESAETMCTIMTAVVRHEIFGPRAQQQPVVRTNLVDYSSSSSACGELLPAMNETVRVRICAINNSIRGVPGGRHRILN